MRVILSEDVQHVGIAGEVVKVREGYARNYLIPRGLAMLATEGKVREMEHKKRIIEERVKKQIKGHEKVALQIHKVRLSFTVKAGEEGKLFGSVTSSDIHQQLAEQGIEVDRRRIELPDPIKQLGDYKVPVRLHREVRAEIRVEVVAEAGSAIPAAAPDADEESEVEAG